LDFDLNYGGKLYNKIYANTNGHLAFSDMTEDWYFKIGKVQLLYSLIDGVIFFTVMFLIKKLGDFLFKKESMGGGDIKLLFVFGLVLGWEMAILSIFIASFLGLPVSFILSKKNDENIIPFVPFLVIAALIIIFLKIDINTIINLYNLFIIR
jgi:prepilin signal peptidase PulO-like enzyme (type II secretory pathway)